MRMAYERVRHATLINQRFRWLLLAVVPLLFVIVAVAWIVQTQFDRLAQVQLQAVEPILLQARKDEIKHFVQTGRRAVADLIKRNGDSLQTQHEARELLRSMDFGPDNYFFVYDVNGRSIMHPRTPQMEGADFWQLRDVNGVMIIQRLVAEGRAGGGFVDFVWNRPSTNRLEAKLGYAEIIEEWGWMVGSGLYLDAQQETESRLRASIVNANQATRFQILLVSCAAVVMVFAGVLMLNVHEQRKADSKVRMLAQQVVQSQELERTRVARELHDGVSQSLASVKYLFECADIQLDRGMAAAASMALKGGITQIIEVMVDVRRMSHDLYPTILDDGGLGMALEQLAREFSSRTGIPVEVAIKGIPEMQRDAAKALFRFSQQALANIESHAKATQVKILLRQDGGILLQVEDDGIGFKAQATMLQPRDGLGLTSMRERVQMLGGDFAIHSEPGLTVLKAYLPRTSFAV
jgi:two-component system, NarL family, sensor kinase